MKLELTMSEGLNLAALAMLGLLQTTIADETPEEHQEQVSMALAGLAISPLTADETRDMVMKVTMASMMDIMENLDGES